MHALDFATVDDEGVALATVVTEHGVASKVRSRAEVKAPVGSARKWI